MGMFSHLLGSTAGLFGGRFFEGNNAEGPFVDTDAKSSGESGVEDDYKSGSSKNDSTKNDSIRNLSLKKRPQSTTNTPDIVDLMKDYKYPYGIDEENVPIVVMHGVTDSGDSEQMQKICGRIAEIHTKTIVRCLQIHDGHSSWWYGMDHQVKTYAAAVTEDPVLSNGFYSMGVSQGGLISMVYIERYNMPEVKRFVSVSSPQHGFSQCGTSGFAKICKVLMAVDYYLSYITSLLSAYKLPFSVLDYWRPSHQKERYLAQNEFLPDINNEGFVKKRCYKHNMINLEAYALVKTIGDALVSPNESSWHGHYKWGTDPNSATESDVLKMEETPGYLGDWIGLKTLNESGRMFFHSYTGDHIHLPPSLWTEVIERYLGKELNGGNSFGWGLKMAGNSTVTQEPLVVKELYASGDSAVLKAILFLM
jgi:palmitoyl-protein thioesterase